MLPRRVPHQRAPLQTAAHEAQVEAHSERQDDGNGAYGDDDDAEKAAVLLPIHVQLQQQRDKQQKEKVHLRDLRNQIQSFLRVRRHDESGHERAESNQAADDDLSRTSGRYEREYGCERELSNELNDLPARERERRGSARQVAAGARTHQYQQSIL